MWNHSCDLFFPCRCHGCYFLPEETLHLIFQIRDCRSDWRITLTVLTVPDTCQCLLEQLLGWGWGGTTLVGFPTVVPHAAEGSSAEQFSSVFRGEWAGSRTSASPPSPDHIVLSNVPAQFFPAAALWSTPLQGEKKSNKKAQTMTHLLEPARLPDQIYSTPTTAVAEIWEAMCCEARAGKRREIGTF